MKSTLRIATATLLLPLIAGVLVSMPTTARAAGATQPKYLPPQVTRDRDNRNDGERDKRDRDQAIRDQAIRDQAIREQASRDQAIRDQRDRDQRDRYNRPDDNRNTDWRNGNNGRDNDHRHDSDWRDGNGCKRDCRHSTSDCRININWRDSNGCRRDCRHNFSGCRVYDNWRDSNGCKRDCRHNFSGCRVYDNWRDSNGCKRDCRHNTSDCRRAPVVIFQGGGYGHNNGNHYGWNKPAYVAIDMQAIVLRVFSQYRLDVRGDDGRIYNVSCDDNFSREIGCGDRVRVRGYLLSTYSIHGDKVQLISTCRDSGPDCREEQINFPGYIEDVRYDRNIFSLRVRGDNGVCYSVSISGGSYRNGDRVRVIGSYSNGVIGATYCGR